MSLLLCLALAACCVGAYAESADGTKEILPGSLTAVEMTRLMGNGINLGNTMEACNNGKNGGFTQDIPTYYEMYWGQPLTKPDMLQAMKDCGT